MAVLGAGLGDDLDVGARLGERRGEGLARDAELVDVAVDHERGREPARSEAVARSRHGASGASSTGPPRSSRTSLARRPGRSGRRRAGRRARRAARRPVPAAPRAASGTPARRGREAVDRPSLEEPERRPGTRFAPALAPPIARRSGRSAVAPRCRRPRTRRRARRPTAPGSVPPPRPASDSPAEAVVDRDDRDAAGGERARPSRPRACRGRRRRSRRRAPRPVRRRGAARGIDADEAAGGGVRFAHACYAPQPAWTPPTRSASIFSW